MNSFLKKRRTPVSFKAVEIELTILKLCSLARFLIVKAMVLPLLSNYNIAWFYKVVLEISPLFKHGQLSEYICSDHISDAHRSTHILVQYSTTSFLVCLLSYNECAL